MYFIIGILLLDLIVCEEYEIARGKSVRQSCNSTSDARCRGSAAVDGDANTFTIAFDDGKNINDAYDGPWLQVDLKNEHLISRVMIAFKQNISRIIMLVLLRNNNSTKAYPDANYNSHHYWSYMDRNFEDIIPFNKSVSLSSKVRFVTVKSLFYALCLPINEILIFTNEGITTTKISTTISKATTNIMTLDFNATLLPESKENNFLEKINIIIGIVVGVGLFLFLLLAIILIYIFRCKKNKKNRPEIFSKASVIRTSAPSVADNKRSVVGVEDFETYVKNMRYVKYSNEFKDLPDENILTKDIASQSANHKKNRFKNIKPFDHNIVPLKTSEYQKDDYINASFIQGYLDVPEVYIACQAPKKITIRDHWKMILDYKITIVVMLTPLFENNKKKSEQYWPDKINAETAYNDVSVTLKNEEFFSDFVLREISVTCISDPDEIHYLKHLQFISWKDKGVPACTYPLLAFIRFVKKLALKTEAPILVHCSAGVGRTGSFLAIDYLVEQVRAERRISVFECVGKLRQQRMLMVQTEEQYEFVHEATLDAVLHGDSGYDNEHFISQSADQQIFDIGAKFEAFGKLRHFTRPSIGKTNKNESKNRNKNIYAYDEARISVPSTYTSNEYINAAVCDSYYKNKSYILTQTPLPNTLEDFWNTIVETQIQNIILLDQIPNDQSSPQFLPPSNSELVIGNYQLKDIGVEQENGEIVTQMIKYYLRGSEVGCVEVFSLSRDAWPPGEDVPISTLFLTQLHRKIRNRGEKLVFQCLDGSSRCGLIAAAFHLLDRMKCEQIVDPLLACRFIIHARPQAIFNEVQFRYLYKLAYDHLTVEAGSDEYANNAYAHAHAPIQPIAYASGVAIGNAENNSSYGNFDQGVDNAEKTE